MNRRIIPPKVKIGISLINNNIIKNFTVSDLGVVVVFLSLAAFILTSVFPGRLWLAVIVLTIGLSIIAPMGYYKIYQWLNILRLYFISRKKYKPNQIKELLDFEIDEDCLKSGRSYAAIIHISPVEFFLFKNEKQLNIISQFAEIIKNIKSGSIIKIERPLNFNNYIQMYNSQYVKIEKEKEEYINLAREDTIKRHKKFDENSLSLKQFNSRLELLNNAITYLHYNNTDQQVFAEVFYIAIYAANKEQLHDKVRIVTSQLYGINLIPNLLEFEQLHDLMSYFMYKKSLDKFVFPYITQKSDNLIFEYGNEKTEKKIATIAKWPVFADGNGWATPFFTIADTVAVMNFDYSDIEVAKKRINKTINELEYRYIKARLATDQQSLRDQVEALRVLLQQIDYNNESMHAVNFYIMFNNGEAEKRVKETIETLGFKIHKLQCQQFNAFLSMLPCVKNDLLPAISRDLQSDTLAAAFPFVNNLFLDEHGQFLGDYRYPVFFDIWQRGSNRVNSNMCIIGQSGGGKTYLQKKLIMQERLIGTKVYILDCEAEYNYQADMLGGEVHEMTGGENGIINPFQVFPSFLATDDEILFDDMLNIKKNIITGDVNNHRMFLVEWLKDLLKLEPDTKSKLGELIKDLYDDFKIHDDMDLNKIDVKDYPTFDDLYKKINQKLGERKIDDYDIGILRKLKNYLADFAKGGIYSRLWNGYTSLDIKNDFIVFDFQKLFANQNNIAVNAQMMLLMRLLMNEIIKIKNQNENNNVKQRVWIIVDEAHRYISSQYPVALDTLEQFARRIRKYDGALGVSTQSISDFLGTTDEMRRKASAIINNCQYNFLFGLKADDMIKVKELYSSYGDGLTAEENYFLTTAQRGHALFLAEPEKRQIIKIGLFPDQERFLIQS